jgi:hypothetical protein
MGKYKTFGSRFDRVHRNDLNANFAAVEADINSQKSRVDDLIIGTPQPSEVVDSRGGFPVLGDRLEDLSSSLAQMSTKAEVDTKVAQIVSGSPKGTYATLAALQTEFPTGTTGVFIVTADGKWYYWSGSAWTAGGTYQSTGVGDRTLTKDKISLKSISINEVDFLEVSGKNLFNKNTAIQGFRLASWSTGFPLSSNVDYYVSDYIKVSPNTAYKKTQTYATAFYDSSLTFISGVDSTSSFTTPANCVYIRISIYKTTLDIEQVELGTVSTSYENFVYNVKNLKANNDITTINNNMTALSNQVASVNTSVQKLDSYKNFPSLLKTGDFLSEKAQLSTFKGWAYPFNTADFTSDLHGIRIYVCIGTDVNIPAKIVILDNNFVTLQSFTTTIAKTGSLTFVFPASVKLSSLTTNFYVGITTTDGTTVLVPPNTTVNPSYNARGLNELYTTNSGTSWVASAGGYKGALELLGDFSYQFGSSGTSTVNNVKLILPSKYELVVGDTFELFYKGILLTNNPHNYNFKVTCSKGNAYSKRFIYTPSTGDIGTYVLTISVYGDDNNLLDNKNVNLIVKNKATNPISVANILCVGDSLTANGTWVSEVCRRLTGSGGTPAGEGLTNPKFIGSLTGTSGAKYEGYGGWTYTNYNGNALPPNYWVTVTSGMKTNTVSSQSIWQDANGKQWQLETLDTATSKIKFKQYPAGSNNVMPASGTLTFVSGGGDTTAIVFSASVTESSNPFWIGGKVDFTAYATQIGASSIDHCYILLGWNSTGDSETKVKGDIRTFINNLRTSFPNSKVTLLGLQVPSIDGFGANYGASWNFMDKLQVVFNFDKWYKEVAAEFTNVDFVNISGQFDTENNMQTGTRAVNARNAKTETYGTNGVHPANEGYLQIADAVYRNLTHKI